MTDKQIILSLTRELEAATKPKWVSVDDELPAKSGQYLVKVPNSPFNRNGQAVSEFSKLSNPNFGYDRIHMDRVTHWQPLPPAPEVK